MKEERLRMGTTGFGGIEKAGGSLKLGKTLNGTTEGSAGCAVVVEPTYLCTSHVLNLF